MLNVACAVIVKNDCVLACLRPEGKSLAGKWEFPGGKIEPGEQVEQAIVREIKEELDCVIEVNQILEAVEHHYDDFAIRLTPCIAQIVSGEPLAIEHQEIRWLDAKSIYSVDWAAADVPVIAQVLESLAQMS